MAEATQLSDRTEIIVRFNEADPLGIVWHGHYIRYFEDGRESFGNTHGLRYLDFYREGVVVPVVSIHCDYKRALRYGESVVVETLYRPCDAARLEFAYRLYNAGTQELVATGSSVQVFLDRETNVLRLTNPAFYEDWKNKHGLM